VQSLNFRAMPDSYLPDWHQSLEKVLALDWERLIPGHPGPGGRLGTKEDVKNHLAYMNEVSAEAKKLADAGRCNEAGIKEVKMEKYSTWIMYEQWLPMNIERYCTYWRDKK
jgi:hypothetical protein